MSMPAFPSGLYPMRKPKQSVVVVTYSSLMRQKRPHEVRLVYSDGSLRDVGEVALQRWEKKEDAEQHARLVSAALAWEPQEKVVHVLWQGRAICPREGEPGTWRAHEVWVGPEYADGLLRSAILKEITCPDCQKRLLERRSRGEIFGQE